MDSKQYAPGTMAAATVQGEANVRVMHNGYTWTSAGRTGHGLRHHAPEHITDIRPLVVLDLQEANDLLSPAEAAECAVRTLRGSDWLSDSSLADQIEQQTRPPKPPEPTGLGAVVEDAEGEQWVYLGAGPQSRESWRLFGNDAWADWSDIDAVKVLSEGVTP